MKKSVKLPVVSKNVSDYPQKAICPVCGVQKVFEPHSFAAIDGGALLMNRRNDSGTTSSTLDAFMGLTWHGGHDVGNGKDREIYTKINIAKDVRGGYFCLYFCSTKCLRLFLNSCVDELETSIKKAKRDYSRWPINKKRS
ncbi:MAG: hypothetical protein WDA22_17640 [Bacteroidota bacterium]